MEFLSRLKLPVKIEGKGFSQEFVLEEISLMELIGYLNFIELGLPNNEEERKRAVIFNLLPLMLQNFDANLFQFLAEILSYDEILNIVNKFNSINGVTKMLTQSVENEKKPTKKDTVSWSEICFDLAGHFGTTPDEIAKRFSLRQIERFFEIHCKRQGEELKFQAQIHGIQVDGKPDSKSKNEKITDWRSLPAGVKV